MNRSRKLISILLTLALCISSTLPLSAGAVDLEANTDTLIIDGSDVSIADGSVWTLTGTTRVGDLTLSDTSSIVAESPVTLYYRTSDTVTDGQTVGNVTYVCYDEAFTVIHTNDVHGHIENEAYVKPLADSFKINDGDDNVITVSAGDIFAGGQAVAHYYNGEKIPAIMSAAGYDLYTPGNNDFAFDTVGPTQLVALAELFAEGGGVCICANLNYVTEDTLEDTGVSVFDPYTTFTTAGGVKVGVFGLTVDSIPMDTIGSSIGSIEAAEASVKDLQADGCSLIVGVAHTGWADDLVSTSNNDTNSYILCETVDGIDGFVDGHTHSIINDGAGYITPTTNTFINQAACYGGDVGAMIFVIKDGEVLDTFGELYGSDELSMTFEPDAATQELVDAALAQYAEDSGANDILGNSGDIFLSAERASSLLASGSVRMNETNLGDMVADAILYTSGADVALFPGFLIRSSIPAGEISRSQLYSVFANGGTVFNMEKTGRELLDILSGNTTEILTGVESTNFDQASGVTYSYCGFSTEGDDLSYVYDVFVGGEPLELDKIYNVAYCAYDPFETEFAETPIYYGTDDMVAMMKEYLLAHADDTSIYYEDVYAPNNRINYAETEHPYTDMPEGYWASGYIATMASWGVLTGTTETTYAPTADASVQDILHILYQLVGSPAAEEYDDTYTAALAWASALGMIEGYEDGSFDATAVVTREDACAFIVTGLGLSTDDVDESIAEAFTDSASIAESAKIAIALLATPVEDGPNTLDGAITGYTDGSFQPEKVITRGEMVKIIYHAFSLVE